MTLQTYVGNSGEIISCTATESFGAWLASSGGSLAITTYQAGKVAIVGWNGQQVSVLLRDFAKPLGLAVQGSRIVLATRSEVILFADAPLLAPNFLEDQPHRYDALFLPRLAYYTGDLNVHDVAFGDSGVWIVNTRFCCLSFLSDQFSFVPKWKPPFVSEIVPEDRCHLNGVAMQSGQPRWVTCLGTTDTPGGWRKDKAMGGVVLSVPDGEIVVRELSMPHSPRWYDGHLWVLNSGQGELLRLDVESGAHEVICALPGYLRGLSFVGPFALVGLCQIREKHIFGGLPISHRFPQLLCGVAVIDLRNGQTVGMFEFTSGCHELFEIQYLPNVRQPMILDATHASSRGLYRTRIQLLAAPSNEISISNSES